MQSKMYSEYEINDTQYTDLFGLSKGLLPLSHNGFVAIFAPLTN